MHYQTKHEEYTSNDSPVLEGQSPVKRLSNGLNKLSSEITQKSSQLNDKKFSFQTTTKIEKKSRKRKRLLSPTTCSSSSTTTTTTIINSSLIPFNKQIEQQQQPIIIDCSNNSNQFQSNILTIQNKTKVLPVNGSITFSSATFSDAPTTSSTNNNLNSYNVEDLLKLDCCNTNSDINTNSHHSSPSSLSTKEQQIPISNIFNSTPSPSQCSSGSSNPGLDLLFREQWLKICSSTALLAQFGNNRMPTINSFNTIGNNNSDQKQEIIDSFNINNKHEENTQNRETGVAAVAAAMTAVSAAALFMQSYRTLDDILKRK
ncbi:C2H2-type domain-containing protein [Meloidogyne graminicola]|uniref:C2H2-type domain-containing protein n=1 Tax=Meloidogyne graminicola TaxID=189291 RepID=A0A8S9ZHE1_9BILA|nr:C2H2-type domain-containing protein [Meloidogyne graminicola]